MKRGACLIGILIMAAWEPLLGGVSTSSNTQIVPEALWALATGGGTWVTSVQITNMGLDTADIDVYFYYNGGSSGPFRLVSGLPTYYSAEDPCILSTIDTLDPGALDYFGKVGAVWFVTANSNCKIHVEALTVNGNYGKLVPSVRHLGADQGVLNANLVIQHLVQNDMYRTFVGLHNMSSTTTFSIRFTIVNAFDAGVGSVFYKTIAPREYLSFNPFKEAGVPSGTYANCWLYINILAGDYGPGVIFFGSMANNYTNDTYALIAKMY
jgi:hypothetical protein